MKALDQLKKNLRKSRVYLSGGLQSLLPAGYLSHRLPAILEELEQLPDEERQQLLTRVDYYNKLQAPFELPAEAEANRDYRRGDKSFSYFMDFKQLVRYFPAEVRFNYLFGDITHVPDVPCFLKSRPISSGSDNQNSILLKLNQIRHYYMVRDELAFEDKEDRLIWRGKTVNDDRMDLVKTYYNHPKMDIGDTHRHSRGEYYAKPFVSVPDQLRFKYVLSVEGIDVATNLKWIMASNSLCFMRPPRFETWFMEGRLEPGRHYVALKDDFSDMEEKVDYYNRHPDQARAIVAEANRHVAQFQDARRERLIALLVMDKYFRLSGQID